MHVVEDVCHYISDHVLSKCLEQLPDRKARDDVNESCYAKVKDILFAAADDCSLLISEEKLYDPSHFPLDCNSDFRHVS